MNDELKDIIKKINGLEVMKPEIEALIRKVQENSFDDRNDTDLERLLFLFNEQWIAFWELIESYSNYN